MGGRRGWEGGASGWDGVGAPPETAVKLCADTKKLIGLLNVQFKQAERHFMSRA